MPYAVPRLPALLGALVLAACGPSSADPGGGPDDVGDPFDSSSTADAVAVDSGRDAHDARDASLEGGDGADGLDGSDGSASPFDASALATCPTSGAGAFDVAGVTCWNFTPADAGAASSGENATEANYALRPSAGAPNTLVLFLSGSRGHPAGAVKAGPSLNLYAAAVADGRAVLGISYSNIESLGSLCAHDDACYFPTRQSIILGEAVPGAALTVSPDEGIVDRTARALRYLAAADPGGGWGGFLVTLDPTAAPKTAIGWEKILVVGHSQGGGHAAAIGKLFPVARVVQLSSTCDSTADGMAVSWTDGAVGPWASDPTQFYGFAASSTLVAGTGDTTCPYHTLNWAHLGMIPAHQNDDAALCGATGNTHDASLRCADNYPTWVELLR